MKTIVLSIVTSLICIAGCTDDNSLNNPKDKDTVNHKTLFPLALGNEWTYQYMNKSSGYILDTFSVVITGEKMMDWRINNVKTSLLTYESSSPGHGYFFNYYAKYKEETLIGTIYSNTNDTLINILQRLADNPFPNAEINEVYYFGPIDCQPCNGITYPNTWKTGDYYYSKGVGLVQFFDNYNHRTGESYIRCCLIDYKLY